MKNKIWKNLNKLCKFLISQMLENKSIKFGSKNINFINSKKKNKMKLKFKKMKILSIQFSLASINFLIYFRKL